MRFDLFLRVRRAGINLAIRLRVLAGAAAVISVVATTLLERGSSEPGDPRRVSLIMIVPGAPATSSPSSLRSH